MTTSWLDLLENVVPTAGVDMSAAGGANAVSGVAVEPQALALRAPAPVGLTAWGVMTGACLQPVGATACQGVGVGAPSLWAMSRAVRGGEAHAFTLVTPAP